MTDDKSRLPIRELLQLFGMLAANNARRTHKGDWIDKLGGIPGLAEFQPLLRTVFPPKTRIAKEWGKADPAKAVAEATGVPAEQVQQAAAAATPDPAPSVPVTGPVADQWNAAEEAKEVAAITGLPIEQVMQMMADGRLHSPGRPKGSAPAAEPQPAAPVAPAAPPDQQSQQQPTQQPSSAESLRQQLADLVAAQGDDQQPAAATDAAPQAAAPGEQPQSRASAAADTAQHALDAVGVVDPTGIADGVNAAWSIGRMFTDPKRWKEHATNAAISAVSMVPYVGDTAKLLKAGKYAKTVRRVAGIGRMLNGPPQGAIADGSGSGGDGSPPMAPPVGGDGDPGNSPRQQQDDTEGVQAYEAWTDRLVDGAKKLAGFTATAAAFIKGLELLNAGVLALNRDLAPYNGQLAGAYARYDADQLQRDVRKGEDLSGPLSKLAEEQSELKDTLDRIVNPLQAIGIELLATLTQGVNATINIIGIAETMSTALEAIRGIVAPFNADAFKEPAFQRFFQDVSDGKFDGRRPDFTGGKVNLWDDEKQRRDIFGP